MGGGHYGLESALNIRGEVEVCDTLASTWEDPEIYLEVLSFSLGTPSLEDRLLLLSCK